MGGIAVVRIWPMEIAALFTHLTHAERLLGAVGWFVAAGLQILIALLGVLPASMGAIAAGMIFGIVSGFVVSGSATIVGAVLAFLLTRSLLRPVIERSLSKHPRIGLLDKAVARDGWRLVALMRISPIMPFALTSYALGLTSIRLRQYLLGSFAALPALLGYVVMGHFAGASLSSISGDKAQPVRLILLALTLSATALLTLRLAGIVRIVLRLGKDTPWCPDRSALVELREEAGLHLATHVRRPRLLSRASAGRTGR